ncbi:MAG: molybdenum cofactor biosynthesis protein MoeB [Bacteroidetes bacterium]|nr:MAG: molybdenum cofactor biosynthesis protein MoeB [Bacteroidota bacterium]
MQSFFSGPELVHYARHLSLPGFGLEAQAKLKAGKVLVVGCGGLGSPLLQYLAAAGVGTIGLIDHDVVDKSNLQRQVLFGMQDLGQPKAHVAAARLEALNPHIELRPYTESLTRENALDLMRDYDVVADGTDNFPTRYLVNDACVLLDKVNVYASVFRFEGQVSVFHFPLPEGRGPNYRDLYPKPPQPGAVPSCAEGGILGVLPGIIGSLQALEVIKVLSGVGEPLAGRLLLFDASDGSSRILKVPRDPENPLTGTHPTQKELIDYPAFCRTPASEDGPAAVLTAQCLSPEAFARWRQEKRSYVLIDVREAYEREISHIGGLLMPAGQILEQADSIPRDIPVVLYCRSGQRSAKVLQRLESQAGFRNLYHLEGGLLAFAREIDPTLPTY